MSLQRLSAKRNKNYTLESLGFIGAVGNPVSASYPSYTIYTNISYRMSTFVNQGTNTNTTMGNNGWPSTNAFGINVTLFPGGKYMPNPNIWKGSFYSTTNPTVTGNGVSNISWSNNICTFQVSQTTQTTANTLSSIGGNGTLFQILSLGTTNWANLGWLADSVSTYTIHNATGSVIPTVNDYFTWNGVEDTSSSPGTVCCGSAQGNFQIQISNVTGFTNFQVNTTQDGQSYIATQRYTNAFINIISKLSHFRTLDWTGTNEIYPNGQHNWTDRYWHNDDIRYTAGTVDGWKYTSDPSILFNNANAANTRVTSNSFYDSQYLGNGAWAKSWEAIISISNDFNKPAWITIPPNVSINYIERLATLFANNIQTNVYIEFANEVWNFGLQNIFFTISAADTLTGYIANTNYSKIVVTANTATITTITPHNLSTIVPAPVAWVSLSNNQSGTGDTGIQNATVINLNEFSIPLSSDITSSLTGLGTISITSGSNQVVCSDTVTMTNAIYISNGVMNYTNPYISIVALRGFITTTTGVVIGAVQTAYILDGSFVIGKTYTVHNVGSTNWNAVGVTGTAVQGTVFVATATSSGASSNLGDATNSNIFLLSSPYTGTSLVNVNYLYFNFPCVYLTPYVSYSGATVNLVGGQTSPIINSTTRILGSGSQDMSQRYTAWMLWCTITAFKTKFSGVNNNLIKGIYASLIINPIFTDETLQWATINQSQLGPVNSWINCLSAAFYCGPFGASSGLSETDLTSAIYNGTRAATTVQGYITAGVLTITSSLTIPFPPGAYVNDTAKGTLINNAIQINSVSGNVYTTSATGYGTPLNVGNSSNLYNFVVSGNLAVCTLQWLLPPWRQLATLYNIEDVWMYEGGLDYSGDTLNNVVSAECQNQLSTPNLGTVMHAAILAAYNSGAGKLSVTGLMNAGYYTSYGWTVFDDLTNTNAPQYLNGVLPAYSYYTSQPNYNGVFTGTISFSFLQRATNWVCNNGFISYYGNTLSVINGGQSAIADFVFIHSNSILNAILPFAIFISDNNTHRIQFCVGSNTTGKTFTIYLDGTVANRFTDGTIIGTVIPQSNIAEVIGGMSLTTYTANLSFTSHRGFHTITVADNTVSPGSIYLASAILT